MDVKVWMYLIYLAVSIGLTIWVARALSRNGLVFLEEVFADERLAEAVNSLLVVGFYLLNLGYVTVAMKHADPVDRPQPGHGGALPQGRPGAAGPRRAALLQRLRARPVPPQSAAPARHPPADRPGRSPPHAAMAGRPDLAGPAQAGPGLPGPDRRPRRPARRPAPAGPMSAPPDRRPTGRDPPDPTAHGGGGVRGFTVLYDAHCPLCRAARRWLASRAQLVPLEFVPAGSAEARRRFPGLDHDATLRDLTVVADTGEVYAGDGAWFACLWALADHRATAERLAQPAPAAARPAGGGRPPPRSASGSASQPADDPGYGDHDDRADCADDRCGWPDTGRRPPAVSRPGSSSWTPRCGCSASAATPGPPCGRSPRRPGVAVGNAYYYFGSKDHLIQEFYARHPGRAPGGGRAGARPGTRRSPPGWPGCCTPGSTC